MLSSASFNALSLSQATSGYSEEVDLEVIDEIIERAPREATTFPLVYRAYLQVLQEHAQDDTIYYQFLLKLGVIRARSWGERWDLWRATHGSPASLPLIHRPPSPSSTHQTSSPLRSRHAAPASTPASGAARAAQVKAKLPFLASASSDLDEGFLPSASARSSPSRDADAELETVASEWRAGNGEQGDVRTRASPRKRLQALADQAVKAGERDAAHISGARDRGRIHYPRSQGPISPRRPDAQLEKVSTYSDGGFVSPKRPLNAGRRQRYTTETAVRSQQTYSGLLSPTPPPYTPSDASASLLDIQPPQHDIDLTADDLAMIDNLDGLATPRAASQQLPSRRLVDVASVSSAPYVTADLDTEAEEEHLYQQESVREMERRAEEFYRTGLMGRCWDTWVQSFEWIKHTTRQIDTIRSNILLRQALLTWRAHHATVLQHPNTADAHRTAHLQRKALQEWSKKLKVQTLERRLDQWTEGRDAVRSQATWLRWKGMLERRVQGRYRAELGRRENWFTAARDKALVQDCVARWRGELRTRQDDRQADAFFSARVFARWRYRAEQEQRLVGQITVWESTRRRRALEGSLHQWHQAAALHRMEGAVMSRQEDRLTRNVFRTWKLRTGQETEARKADQKRLLRSGLASWKAKHQRLAAMARQAQIVQKVNDLQLLRQAFGIWTTRERGNLLDRVRNRRHLKSAFSSWKASINRVKLLDIQAVSLRTDLDLRLQSRALSCMTSALARRRKAQQRAVLMDETRTSILALDRWRHRKTQLEQDAKHADAARAFFVQHTALKVWKIELGRRRQERWVAEREEAMKREVLTHWRDETVRALEGQARADAFRQRADQALLSKCLLRLTHRFIALKSRELDTTAERHTELKRTALIQWARRSREIADKQRLAQSFADLRTEVQLRDALWTWRDRARSQRERRQMLAEIVERRRLQSVRGAWETWRDRVIERRLLVVEHEVALRREDALLFRIWDTWKASTMTLPAISFNKRRLLRFAWERLTAAREDALAIKSFSEPKDARFLAAVFVDWKLKARAKTVARVGRVRGRIRPSHTNISSSSIPPVSAHTSTPSLLSIARRPSTSHVANAQPLSASPAYARLRSELSSSRPAAREAVDDIRGDADIESEEDEASSHLVRALRNLNHR